jgi:integrase
MPRRGRPSHHRRRVRGNGQGSISRLANGSWEAALTLDNGTRTKRRAHSEEEANAKLEELLLLKRQGRLSATRDQSLAQFLAEWLTGKQNLRPNSWANYRALLRHVVDDVGHLKLASVTGMQIHQCYGRLLKANLSKSTVHHIHVLLAMALKDAVDWGVLEKSPAAKVKPPKNEHRTPRPLEAGELDAFLRATAGTRHHALWTLLGTQGLRVGEALALRWSDLDVEKGVLPVHNSITRIPGGGLVIGPVKTPSAHRIIRLTRRSLEALGKHRAIVLQLRMAATVWKDQNLIFPNTRGAIQDRACVVEALASGFKKIGLGVRTPHELRHTFTTMLLDGRADLSTVQKALGHSNPETTLRFYSHVSDRMLEGLATHMDEILDTAGGEDVKTAN